MPSPHDPPSHSRTAGTAAPAADSWLDFFFCLLVLVGGWLYLRDAPFWGRNAYVGSAQFGDAEFWWNGALHFSQGIVAENPNITYRMGYAAFGGVIAAVCGPDYRIFHQLLLLVFLVTNCGLYASLRGLIGRIAAAAAMMFLIFNPYTAEWLAISTSDGLGLVLNLVALVALIAGVRGDLRLRWIAVFGLFLSCASLTRPLMTPFIVPAVLTVVVAAWGAWRKIAAALGIMFAAFLLPTLAWMAFMGATTGNFALTGASQDSSAFYAASDPQIQVWRGDMYAPVEQSAKKRFQTDQPTPKQLNAEFWKLTRDNYQKHWRFHLDRLWRNAFELARFTPQRAAPATVVSAHWRIVFQWSVTFALIVLALDRRRWLAAAGVGSIGATWVLWPLSQPWLVLAASIVGLAALFVGKRGLFLWSAYWWVGVMALYLTGGTWGPPLGGMQDLNALGYRLGFQFFFAGDLILIGCLGWLAGSHAAIIRLPRFTLPSPWASRLTYLGLQVLLASFALLLASGAVIVTARLIASARSTPVPYPDLGSLKAFAGARDAIPLTEITPLRVAVNAQAGHPLLTPAMSSGFIWNLPGQQRSMLLLYQQNVVRPIHMSPRHVYVEISRQLPERAWMNRQGAWILRSFPNTAQNSNLPYYFEMPAVQAFVPLASDGRSYDISQSVSFPLAKSATQLVASGELIINGSTPEWSMNSGTLKFPRRFALKTGGEGRPIELLLDVSRTRGQATFRFGVQLESAGAGVSRPIPVRLQLTATGPDGVVTLWAGDVAQADAPIQVEQDIRNVSRLRLSADNLLPQDTLWFYELVMTADDFAQ